jgi:thioredoxin reductase (NADPH)
MSRRHDVAIVGAGPAGLAAALYAGRARLDTLVLEKTMAGGQILLTDWIENYPGFPDGILPFQLMENFRKQAEKFGARIVLDEILSVEKGADGWVLKGRKETYAARAVIIATGSAYKKLGLPDEARLTGKGVSFCATCDGAFFAGREIAVVGGGDNALRESLFLTKYCRRLTLIHRRDSFRGEKILQERVLAHEKISVVWDSTVEAIHGETRLEAVTIRNIRTGATTMLKIDGLFVSIGTEPQTGFVRELVEVNEWGQIKVSSLMESSLPGIFAAGDVCEACPKQIATAVGTGVQAALAVTEYLERTR